MWEISNKLQAVSFLYSLVLGVIFCAFYDVFRAVRLVFKPKDWQVFLQDIIYFSIISFTTFIFLLSLTNGEIRGYILFGTVLGFCVFYFTVSKYFLMVLKKTIWLINWCFGKINDGCNWLFSKIESIISKISLNTVTFLKKLLKKIKGLLYTKK